MMKLQVTLENVLVKHLPKIVRPSKNRVTVVNVHSHLEKSRTRQSKSRNHFVTDAAPYDKDMHYMLISHFFRSHAVAEPHAANLWTGVVQSCR